MNIFQTQCCLISRRFEKNFPDKSFDSNSLKFIDKISTLGFIVRSTLSWNDQITPANLVFYLDPDAILHPIHFLHYIRLKFVPVSNTALVYEVSKHSLATLDAIQKRVINPIGDPTLSNSLESLTYRRTVSALSLHYRYYHGVCSD